MPGHIETHHAGNSGWLRAAVLGADDGILSTASLMLGVATAGGAHGNLLIAGVAGLVAGAMSMAAGEYVSVHSQADTEQADLALERKELTTDDAGEHEELAAIYVSRGLTPALAKEVAVQLMSHDAIAAHARDELGITDTLRARPLQAAAASAISFACGAAVPLFATLAAPGRRSSRSSRPAPLFVSPSSAPSPRSRAARISRRGCFARPSGARSPWPSPPASARCSAPWCRRAGGRDKASASPRAESDERPKPLATAAMAAAVIERRPPHRSTRGTAQCLRKARSTSWSGIVSTGRDVREIPG